MYLLSIFMCIGLKHIDAQGALVGKELPIEVSM